MKPFGPETFETRYTAVSLPFRFGLWVLWMLQRMLETKCHNVWYDSTDTFKDYSDQDKSILPLPSLRFICEDIDVAGLKMDQLQHAFERAVPDPDDRELLKRKCGEENIQNIYKGAIDLKIPPETAFAKILVVQLQMMRDEGTFHCSTWLLKHLRYNELHEVPKPYCRNYVSRSSILSIHCVCLVCHAILLDSV